MKALILAAGYAKRMYPLTKEYPKPLLLVNRQPIIDYIIDKLQPITEIDEIIVVTNTKFMPTFNRWRARIQRKSEKPISLVDDLTRDIHHRRGAIGDMSFAISKKRIKDDLLVVGGDNLFDEGLDDFLALARYKKTSPIMGVYDIKCKEEAQRFGVVRLNKSGKVIDFSEKPQKPASTLVAMCLYYFPKEKLGLIKTYLALKKNKHDASGFYIDWLRKRVAVYACIFGKRWYDIGHPQTYKGVAKTYGKA